MTAPTITPTTSAAASTRTLAALWDLETKATVLSSRIRTVAHDVAMLKADLVETEPGE